MINRKLIAALVGISLAAGSIGHVSAQTVAAQPNAETAAPVSTMVTPATQPKGATTAGAGLKAEKVAVAKHHRKLAKAGNRAHVAHAARHGKVAKAHAGKATRVSHLAKRGTHKHA